MIHLRLVVPVDLCDRVLELLGVAAVLATLAVQRWFFARRALGVSP